MPAKIQAGTEKRRFDRTKKHGRRKQVFLGSVESRFSVPA
jgi:hypothetical protein